MVATGDDTFPPPPGDISKILKSVASILEKPRDDYGENVVSLRDSKSAKGAKEAKHMAAVCDQQQDKLNERVKASEPRIAEVVSLPVSVKTDDVTQEEESLTLADRYKKNADNWADCAKRARELGLDDLANKVEETAVELNQIADEMSYNADL